MSKALLPAAIVALAVSTGGLTAAASADYGSYSKADKLAKFAEIHGFEHPSVAKRSQSNDRPRLGVAIGSVSQADLDAMSLEYGVRIEKVIPGSIAAGAGLKTGDVVTAIGDRPAYSPERMQHLVNVVEGATTISLTRAEQELKLPLDFTPAIQKADSGKPALGIRIQNMTPALKEAFGAQGNNGVLVSQVNKGSAADSAGLKAGDVVVAIGDQTVQRTSDVLRALAMHSPGDEVDVKILRDRTESALTVALGEAEKAMQYGKGHGKHGYGYKHHGMYNHPYYGRYGHGKGNGSWHGHYVPDATEKNAVQRPS